MVNDVTNTAYIVYASDDKFAEILGISIISLFENSKDMQEIIIYILDSGISLINKEKIEFIFKKYKRGNPEWIKAKNISEEISMKVSTDRGSLSQYARLFISSLLPENIKKVLYLDCDILVIKSIKEIWKLDLHGKIIAALMDAFSRYYRINIGLEPEDIMFNSGVMLVDLEKWKKQKIEEKLLKFISKKNGNIQQGDQGALNAVLSNSTYCFEPCFNSVSIYFDFSYDELLVYRKPPVFYKQSQIKKAVTEPYIVHFTTSFISKRPWIEGCCHPYAREWIKYKNISPWKNIPLWKDSRREIYKTAGFIAEHMPRKIMCFIFGILQAYVRPRVNYIKDKFY